LLFAFSLLLYKKIAGKIGAALLAELILNSKFCANIIAG